MASFINKPDRQTWDVDVTLGGWYTVRLHPEWETDLMGKYLELNKTDRRGLEQD